MQSMCREGTKFFIKFIKTTICPLFLGKKLLPKLNRGKRFIIPFKETAIKLFSRNHIVW